jgi:uncharacterized membrane protein YadS
MRTGRSAAFARIWTRPFPVQKAAFLLTVVSMAALGLGVDLRVIGQVGAKVTTAVTLSLIFLIAISFCLIRYVIPT